MINKNEYELYIQRHYKESPNTKAQYLRCFKRYTDRYNEINQESIDGFFTNYQSTIQNRAFITSIIKCYKVKLYIDLPKPFTRKKMKLIKYLTKKEIEHIIEQTQFKVSTATRLFWDTGLRLNELMSLNKSDINFETNTVKGTGKGGKDFMIVFSKATSLYLKKLLDQSEGIYPFHYEGIKNQNKKLWYDFKKECNVLGILNAHPHMIRHGLGRFLRVTKGFDLEEIRKRLRHDSVATTQIYSEASEEEINSKMINEVFEDD